MPSRNQQELFFGTLVLQRNKRSNNVWDKIVDPRDGELLSLKSIVNDLLERGHQVFVNVNNHYEGSAPRTIEKIKALLQLA